MVRLTQHYTFSCNFRLFIYLQNLISIQPRKSPLKFPPPPRRSSDFRDSKRKEKENKRKKRKKRIFRLLRYLGAPSERARSLSASARAVPARFLALGEVRPVAACFLQRNDEILLKLDEKSFSWQISPVCVYVSSTGRHFLKNASLHVSGAVDTAENESK